MLTLQEKIARAGENLSVVRVVDKRPGRSVRLSYFDKSRPGTRPGSSSCSRYEYLGSEVEQDEQRLDVNNFVGTSYRRAEVNSGGDVVVMERDPAVMERALRGHADTQNALADLVERRGFAPQSPQGRDLNFDIAWLDGDVMYVAEIKSTTPKNEKQQLRYGLGQLLWYANELELQGRQVQPVLVVENKPALDRWATFCQKHGVVLTYPPFEALAVGA